MSLNLDKCIEQLMKCEMLSESTVKEICDKVKELLIDESNIVTIRAPVTVVGDIHGYSIDLFFILLRVFQLYAFIPFLLIVNFRLCCFFVLQQLNSSLLKVALLT